MIELPRVPMPPNVGAFIADADLALTAEGSSVRMGRRISMDIADEVWVKAGRAAIAHAVERLANDVVHRHGPEIHAAVHSFILDRSWAEPIIREAIRESVHAVILDMLGNTKFADMAGKPTTPREIP